MLSQLIYVLFVCSLVIAISNCSKPIVKSDFDNFEFTNFTLGKPSYVPQVEQLQYQTIFALNETIYMAVGWMNEYTLISSVYLYAYSNDFILQSTLNLTTILKGQMASDFFAIEEINRIYFLFGDGVTVGTVCFLSFLFNLND